MRMFREKVSLLVSEYGYLRMSKAEMKERLVNEISIKLVELIRDEDLKVERTAGPVPDQVKVSLTFDFSTVNKLEGTRPSLAVIDECLEKERQEEEESMINVLPMSTQEIENTARGNPGAISALLLSGARTDIGVADGIRYHRLTGEHLYVIYNDCCGRNVHLFKFLLTRSRSTIILLLSGYEDTERGQRITSEWVAGQPSR